MFFDIVALSSPSYLSSTYDTLIVGGAGVLMAIPSLASAGKGSARKLRAWLRRKPAPRRSGEALRARPAGASTALAEAPLLVAPTRPPHPSQAVSRQLMHAYFEAMQAREYLAAMRERKTASMHTLWDASADLAAASRPASIMLAPSLKSRSRPSRTRCKASARRGVNYVPRSTMRVATRRSTN